MMVELDCGFSDLSRAAIRAALGSVVGPRTGVLLPSIFGLSAGKEVRCFWTWTPHTLAAGGEPDLQNTCWSHDGSS